MQIVPRPTAERFAALQTIQRRRPVAVQPPAPLQETWASDVFTLERMKEALHRIQALRYVEGLDVTDPQVLGRLAPDFGLAMKFWLGPTKAPKPPF